MYQITEKADGWHIATDGVDWGNIYVCPTWSEAYDVLYKTVNKEGKQRK